MSTKPFAITGIIGSNVFFFSFFNFFKSDWLTVDPVYVIPGFQISEAVLQGLDGKPPKI